MMCDDICKAMYCAAGHRVQPHGATEHIRTTFVAADTQVVEWVPLFNSGMGVSILSRIQNFLFPFVSFPPRYHIDARMPLYSNPFSAPPMERKTL
ncbi:hypothetical protein Hypma_005159 [Hypsizygus marmoreus]|uniref:Uncharacterized protein n=1 Tax=Hypsizygus marmoreus TaxID=39966 RepID=A0A369JXH8_HYPMA|nr:hypothetical protein Hypma_005159 [Hypsizygus marmoreus]